MVLLWQLWLAVGAGFAQDDPASTARASADEERCPVLREVGAPFASRCAHPGASRGLLAGVGAVAAGAGTYWFLIGGDSWRSGDPAGQAVGIGLVGAGGAVLGGVTALLAPRDEGAVRDRPARPTARISMGLGGATALDERRPTSLAISADPTLTFGARWQVQPHISFSPGFFSTVDVDPRPQATAALDGQASTFPVGRTVRRSRFAAGAELAYKPQRVVEGLARPGRLELRWRPQVQIRRRTLHPDTPRAQVLQQLTLLPLTLGTRWHVTPRQRFTWFLGPRLDLVGYSVPGSGSLEGGGGPVWGSLYGEAYYQIDVPLTHASTRKTRWTGRFNLGYLHTNLDGQSLDTGAIIGFFGPVDVSWDLRRRHRGSSSALQATVGTLIAHGGGPYLELGAVLGGG